MINKSLYRIVDMLFSLCHVFFSVADARRGCSYAEVQREGVRATVKGGAQRRITGSPFFCG